MPSKEFKNLPESTQRFVINKIHNMMEANFKQNDIISIITEQNGLSKKIILECIDIIKESK